MNTAAETLLILVSSTLTVFLIVLIIALVYLVKLLKSLNRITEHAENVAESVESAAYNFEKAAAPMGILKMLASIIDQTGKHRNRKG